MLRESIVVSFLFICGASLSAQTPTFNVRTTITASDDIRNTVMSCLNRELRSLGDVELTDENPLFELQVVAMSVDNRGGQTTGVVYSVTVLQSVRTYVEALRESMDMTTFQQGMLGFLTYAVTVEDHWLRVGSDDQARELCQGIVEDLDVEHLEPIRAALRGRSHDEPGL